MRRHLHSDPYWLCALTGGTIRGLSAQACVALQRERAGALAGRRILMAEPWHGCDGLEDCFGGVQLLFDDGAGLTVGLSDDEAEDAGCSFELRDADDTGRPCAAQWRRIGGADAAAAQQRDTAERCTAGASRPRS